MDISRKSWWSTKYNMSEESWITDTGHGSSLRKGPCSEASLRWVKRINNGEMEAMGMGSKREKETHNFSWEVGQRLCPDSRDLRQLGVGRTKLIRKMMIQEWGHGTNSRTEDKIQADGLGMWPLPLKLQVWRPEQKLAGTILLENQGTSKVEASREIPRTVADRIFFF